MGELPPNLTQWMRYSPPELKIMDLLRAKITGNDHEVKFIYEAENCGRDPWDLRDLCLCWWDICGIKMEYPEWWLFLPQDRNGKRSKRATNAGFWKVTGQPKKIMSDSGLIGKKNFLVFYTGTRPGNRTHWVMHEYSTTLEELDGTLPGQKPFVLCRLSDKQKKSVTDPNLNFAGTAVSSPTTAFEVQAEATTAPQIFYETISDCGDICFCAHAAENQLGEDAANEEDLQAEEMISELLQTPFDIGIPSSTSLLNRSTPTSVDRGDRSFSTHASENQLEEDTATEGHLQVEEIISEPQQNPVHLEILNPSSTSLLNRSTTTPVDRGDRSSSAHAAENQLGEDTATEEDQQLQMLMSGMWQDPAVFELSDILKENN